ncbi:MAG: helix-turn-helix domain-containing protein [Acidimicrobiia bacterium]
MSGCSLSSAIEATAARFQVDAKTVRKWRDRFPTEGAAGLVDRSSRPPLAPQGRRRMVDCVVERGWTSDRHGGSS